MHSAQSDVRRNTLYKRPGPPTPSKNSGRISVGGGISLDTGPSSNTAAGMNHGVKEKPSKTSPSQPGKLRSLFTSSKSSAASSSGATASGHHEVSRSELVVVNNNKRCGLSDAGRSPLIMCPTGEGYCCYHCHCSGRNNNVSTSPSLPSSVLSVYLSPIVSFVMSLLCANWVTRWCKRTAVAQYMVPLVWWWWYYGWPRSTMTPTNVPYCALHPGVCCVCCLHQLCGICRCGARP